MSPFKLSVGLHATDARRIIILSNSIKRGELAIKRPEGILLCFLPEGRRSEGILLNDPNRAATKGIY